MHLHPRERLVSRIDQVEPDTLHLVKVLTRLYVVVRGLAGYGEGGVMTMRDYSKFLRMLTNNGYVGKKRVLSPVAWKWVMTSTVITDEGMRSYNQEGQLEKHSLWLPYVPLPLPFLAQPLVTFYVLLPLSVVFFLSFGTRRSGPHTRIELFPLPVIQPLSICRTRGARRAAHILRLRRTRPLSLSAFLSKLGFRRRLLCARAVGAFRLLAREGGANLAPTCD